MIGAQDSALYDACVSALASAQPHDHPSFASPHRTNGGPSSEDLTCDVFCIGSKGDKLGLHHNLLSYGVTPPDDSTRRGGNFIGLLLDYFSTKGLKMEVAQPTIAEAVKQAKETDNG